MKNQNPQDILNEILLRMKYDSSKTLTENKKFVFEQPVDFESLPETVMPGFVKLSKEQEIPNWEAIRSPNNKILYVPKGTVVNELFSSDDWDLGPNSAWYTSPSSSLKYWLGKDRGGLGNSKTDSWVPDDFRGVFKIGSVKRFTTPDGQTFGVRLTHPELAKFKSYEQVYAAEPNPYGWTFGGYYNIATNKPYNLSPDKSKIVAGKSEVVQDIMDDLYPRNKEQIELFQKFLNFYYPTWYNGKALNQYDQFFGTMGPKTKEMFSKKDVQQSWNLFLKGYGTTLSNSGFPKMAEPPKNDRSYYYAGNTRHEYDIAQYDKQKNEWYNKFINNFGEEFFRYYFPDVARQIDMGRGSEQQKQYEKELEELNKQYPYYGVVDDPDTIRTNPTTEAYRKEYQSKLKQLKDKYKLTRFDSDDFETETTTDMEIPKGSKKIIFESIPTDDFNNFKSSFVIDPLIGELSLQDFFYTKYPIIFNRSLKNTLKSFTLPPPHNDLIFKRKIYKMSGELNIDTTTFYANSGGKLIKYVPRDFQIPTWWDTYGDKILMVGSILIAFLGPETWPFLAAAFALDALAVADAIRKGDNEGAKLAALLAFVPFAGKMLVGTTKAEYQILAQKFAKASTSDDVARIMSALSEEELKMVKSAQELGDIQGLAKNAEVRKAIKNESKLIKGMPIKVKQRIGIQLGVVAGALTVTIPDILAQNFEDMDRQQRINLILKKAQETGVFTEDELKQLQELYTKKFVTDQKQDFIDELNKKKKLLENKKQEIVKQAENEEVEAVKKAGEELSNFFDSLIKSMDETTKLIDAEGTTTPNEKDKPIINTLKSELTSVQNNVKNLELENNIQK